MMIWAMMIWADQSVAVGTKSSPQGPTEDLWGSQKGLLGPKRALLGAPGVPQRSLKRPEHTIWMLPTQLDQPVAVGTKSGSFVPSEDLQGPLRTSRAPKRAFLGLGGYLYGP